MMANASNIRCLITAGPTREFFDPVRYITNPSSGKMGYALAQAAIDLRWSVDLVSGPVSLKEPDGCILYPVVTGEDMFHQVDALFDACDVFIMTAAVCDQKPRTYHPLKQKKTHSTTTVELEPVVDILKTVLTRKKDQITLGFAAETDNLVENAQKKIHSKNCDFIAVNKVGGHDSAFGSDENQITLISKNGQIKTLALDSKINLAKQLLNEIYTYSAT